MSLLFSTRWFLAAVLLWGLDYKPEQGESALFIHIPVLCFYLLAFFRTILAHKCVFGALAPFFFTCFWFLLPSMAMGFLYGQQPSQLFANIVSFSLYISATASIFSLLKNGTGTSNLLHNMKKVCLAFMLIHFLVAYVTNRGLDLQTSRYQYLSGANIPASALIVASVLQGFTFWDILILITNISTILISVTRTQFAVLLGQFAAVAIAAPLSLLRSRFISRSLICAFMLISVLAVDGIAGTGLSDRWFSRLTVAEEKGADPTALSRIAEVNYMLQAFTESIGNTMFGNGLSAKTKMIGKEYYLAHYLVGGGQVHSNGFGHNNHISILFIGGIIFGLPLLVLTFLNGGQAILFIRDFLKKKYVQEDSATVQIGLWGGIIVIGMLATGFLSGTFADRAVCLWYGIGTGMLYWARTEFLIMKNSVGTNCLQKKERP